MRDDGAVPTTPRAVSRPRSFTEQARRAQLIDVTVKLIAAHGYTGCSLQRIAESAGITKAAVIYHFASKQAVIRAAYDTVIAALVEHVGALVAGAATPADRVDAYVRGLIGHMSAHPDHVRVIVEAIDDHNDTGVTDRPDSPARWQPLAELVDGAKSAGQYRPDIDSRAMAIMLGGAIDAAVAEWRRDPSFDLGGVADTLVEMLHRTAHAG